jgi:nitrate/TMAO reductase-like tetraheme cytochrome c subunit
MTDDGDNLNDASDETSDTDASIRKQTLYGFVLPIIASIIAGAALGGGVFTFDYAKGTSYLSSASETCANCHIMHNHYDA